MENLHPTLSADAQATVKNLSLSYVLTYDEALSSFLFVSTRHSKTTRKILSILLLTLTAVLVILYGFYPYHLEYMILSLLSLAAWAMVMPYPSYKAKRGAKAVARAKGEYKVELFSDGYIQPWGGQRLPLSGDKAARGYETDELFVLRPDSLHTFCLPKRVMTPSEIAFVHELFAQYLS